MKQNLNEIPGGRRVESIAAEVHETTTTTGGMNREDRRGFRDGYSGKPYPDRRVYESAEAGDLLAEAYLTGFHEGREELEKIIASGD